nr:ribonuclease H-like domain-containing protein [Tanacetum cinerariifolium]
MTFVSSPSPNSTNELPADFGVRTVRPQVSIANLSDATVYAFLANQPNGSQLVHEDLEQIHEDDLEDFNLKVPRNQENKTRNQETTRRTVNVEEISSKAFSVKISEPDKENNDTPLIEDWESEEENEVESPPEVDRKTVKPSVAKARCKYHQRKRMVNGTNHSRVNPSANKVPKAVLTRTSLKPVNYEFDGGYVAFGGGAKGGKITSKEIIRTADESHVLLKVPRKNNMYSVDMKNIVPKKDLTCLVAKATNDESMFWHRRLCHINFKNMNKLVKENLVRGNTACYVQNRVLVVKPHFKTPYELFRGRTPALSFMRPFGCHVTIFNTLYHLGKFDGKSDEGFFVGYSTTSKTFRVYNTKTMKEKGARFDACQSSMTTEPVQDYILMPLWNDGLLFDSSLKDSDGDNKDNDGPCKESEIDNQVRPNAKNSTKDVNTAGPSINTASSNINTATPTFNIVRQSDDLFGADNDMRSLDGVKVDISNISTTYHVPTTPNTKIHKDHSLDNVIGDIQPGFEDLDYPDKVYKVEKALYGLHQAPRACQEKYIDEILRKFKYTDVKPASTPMDKEKALLKDSDGDDVDVYLYGSMIGSLMYLTSSRPDIIFACKKQNVVATSTTEAEYVAAASCCGQEKHNNMVEFDIEQEDDKVCSSQIVYLEFCDKHNMVAFLKKPQGSENFHQIVDFLKASHIRYALTENPTIYVSLTNQFWRTASVKKLNNGEIELNETVDGQDKTITEASVRRHLKLADVDGISTLPTTETFEQLALMGVAYEAITKEMHDGLGRATTTASSLEAKQGSGNISKTQTKARPKRLSNMPNEPPLEEGNTSRSEEGSMQLLKLMDIYIKLSDKVTALEDELKTTKVVYNKALITLTKRIKQLEKMLKHKRRRVVIDSSEDKEASLDHKDSPKQGRMIEEIGEDGNVNLVQSRKQGEAHETAEHRMESDNTDEKTLAETLESIKKSATKDKADEDLALRMLEEERESLSIEERSRLLTEFIDKRKKMLAAKRAEEKRNKPPTQAQQRIYMSKYIKNIGGYTLKQLKQYSFKEIKMLFDNTMESIRKFVPMESEGQVANSKVGEGSSKDGESLKRPAEERKEKKKDVESSKHIEEEIAQQEDVVAKQAMK